jgi:hypothetical protein
MPGQLKKIDNASPNLIKIYVGPNPTSSIPSHPSQAKADFFYSKPFQAGQN